MAAERPVSKAAEKSGRNLIPPKVGIGLRFPHHAVIDETRPQIAWLEVHTENYLGGGTPIRILESLARDYPISLHGVALSLGGADDLDAAHLAEVRDLAARIQPGLVSEHLSWSAVGGVHLADLLPLPMTEEALDVVCRHVDQVQAALARKILVENPSSYLRFAHSTIPEWEFMAALAKRTGCGILCDVNNIYVSACNHGWDAQEYLAALPRDAIGEIHLAGHSVRALEDGKLLRIDDHGSRVSPPVWALYVRALERFGPLPTLIEWDAQIPALDVLLDEARLAAHILSRYEAANAFAS